MQSKLRARMDEVSVSAETFLLVGLDRMPHSSDSQVFDYAKIGSPRQHGGKWYVYHNSGLQNQFVLYQLEGDTFSAETAKVFLDLNEEFPEGTTSLKASSFSPDGKYFAYALSVSGSDWSTIKIRDTATGADLPDRVCWVKFSGISWAADSSGFVYSRYAAPAGVAPPNVEGVRGGKSSEGPLTSWTSCE